MVLFSLSVDPEDGMWAIDLRVLRPPCLGLRDAGIAIYLFSLVNLLMETVKLKHPSTDEALLFYSFQCS